MEKPLVSVIMPAYNAEKFIVEAIESILNQTYKNFEFIIIDDCSTDSTWEIIQAYALKDSRIRAFRNEKNLKIVQTRNKGFSLMDSKAKYVAIMDSDDISLPERLEKEVFFLEKNPDYGVVGSHIIIIDEKSNRVARRRYCVSYAGIKKNILVESPFAQPTVMIRISTLEKVGFYDNRKFDRARDYDLWVRIFDKFKIINLDDFLLKYRISSTQGKTTHLKETIRSTLEIQKKWIFKKGYFNFRAFFKIFLEYLLLFLPGNLILSLFKKIKYKN